MSSDPIRRLRMARVHENPRGRTILSQRDADTIRQLLNINETRLRLAMREAIKEGAARLRGQSEDT